MVSLSIMSVSEQLALCAVAISPAGLGAESWSLAPAACAAATAGVAADISRVLGRSGSA